MRIFVVILIALLLGASCATQKRCYTKFPPKTVTVIKDSLVIKDTIIYRDRLVPYKIKGDTVWQEKLIPVPLSLNVSPLVLENTYAIARGWVENSRLKMELIQKDQVITFKLDSADKVAKHWEYRWNNEKQTITLPPVKYTSKFAKFCIGFTIFIIVVIIGWGALKIYKIFKP
jgi:hypothetical protein